MQQPTSNPGASARLDQLERYLEADPDNTTLLGDAIDTALAAGAFARADQHLGRALALQPGDPFLLARRGHVLLFTAQWEAAALLFGELLAATPDVDLAYNFAYACTQLARHADAAAALLPFAATAPVRAMELLLRALHHAGQVIEALALIAANQGRCGDDAGFLAAASLVHLDGGDAATALALSERALALGARPLAAVVTSATLRLGEGDEDGARALFHEAVQMNPRDGRSWSGLGMASLLARDLGTASAQLTKAVEFMPGHIGSWQALGWCRLFADDLEGAVQAFGQALALDRNFGDSHGALAVVAAMRGERAAAQGGIDRALGLDPTSLSARYAQMLLAGETADPARFRALALRLMSSRKTPLGTDFKHVLDAHAPR